MDNQPGRQLMSLVRALTVELDLFGADFARLNQLHPTDVRALIALVEAERSGGTSTPGRLAEHLGLDSSTITALVDRLERLGHVRRERDSTDRRRVLVHLENRAHELGSSFFGSLIDEGVLAMQVFDEAELSTVERFLRAMVDVVGRTREAQNQRSATAGIGRDS